MIKKDSDKRAALWVAAFLFFNCISCHAQEMPVKGGSNVHHAAADSVVRAKPPVSLADRSADSLDATADTVTIRSAAMNRDIRCVVIRPSVDDSLPVLYLLHGWSGNYSNWIMKVPELKQWAATYKMIIVCPDGGYSSWYFDSPVDQTSRYETYIATEVPAFIDQHYATLRGRKSTAITGLSMGGHGALFLAFRHPLVFGAAGSMSGGLDLTVLKNKYDISRRLGDTLRLARNYAEYSVINVIEKKPAEPIAITFDCGTGDAFYTQNVAVHQKMLRLKIEHDYSERPGGHDWKYWKNSLQYQLLFFHDFFEKGK